MLKRSKFTPDQLTFAIEQGDFPAAVIESAPLVACIMTQSWCPQWIFMRSWLRQLEKSEEKTKSLVIHTFETEYDRISGFSEFRNFKEQVWNSWEVPYVRYYVDGVLTNESNYVSSMMFLKTLAQP